jgi:hypothetical protein
MNGACPVKVSGQGSGLELPDLHVSPKTKKAPDPYRPRAGGETCPAQRRRGRPPPSLRTWACASSDHHPGVASGSGPGSSVTNITARSWLHREAAGQSHRHLRLRVQA